MTVPLSRLEWAEMRQDHIDAYIEEHPLPRDLATWKKQARAIIAIEKAKIVGQRRITEDWE